jgi:hypothetical protein
MQGNMYLADTAEIDENDYVFSVDPRQQLVTDTSRRFNVMGARPQTCDAWWLICYQVCRGCTGRKEGPTIGCFGSATSGNKTEENTMYQNRKQI